MSTEHFEIDGKLFLFDWTIRTINYPDLETWTKYFEINGRRFLSKITQKLQRKLQ